MFCCKNKDDGASPVKKPKKAPATKADPEEGSFKLIPAAAVGSEPESEPIKDGQPDTVDPPLEDNTQ